MFIWNFTLFGIKIKSSIIYANFSRVCFFGKCLSKYHTTANEACCLLAFRAQAERTKGNCYQSFTSEEKWLLFFCIVMETELFVVKIYRSCKKNVVNCDRTKIFSENSESQNFAFFLVRNLSHHPLLFLFQDFEYFLQYISINFRWEKSRNRKKGQRKC